MTRRTLRVVGALACSLVATTTLTACATPLRLYPRNGFFRGALPPRVPDSVTVLFGDEVPRCTIVPLGVITYDAARDMRTTSQSVALDGLREYAAELGASGIYQVTFSNGPVTGMGTSVLGVAVASAVQEVNASGTAFACMEELRARNLVR